MGNRYAGLDVLRLIAILLVTIQHGASALGLYEETQVMGLSPGQLGVGMFCAISGYLAFGRGDEAAMKWLLARLKTIYPAYWLAMLFSFGVTWVAGAKAFTLGQFVSQMLGTGYFTHGWELVNVVSWFISLIVLCYVLAAVARASRRPLPVMLMVFAVAAYLLATKTEVNLSRHILAFALAGILRLASAYEVPWPKAAWLLAPIALWFAFGLQFGYVTLSGMALVIALRDYRPQAWIQKITPYIYEYFLLHGIFLVGITKLLPRFPMFGVIIAIGLSMLAAWMLHVIVDRLWHGPRRRPQSTLTRT